MSVEGLPRELWDKGWETKIGIRIGLGRTRRHAEGVTVALKAAWMTDRYFYSPWNDPENIKAMFEHTLGLLAVGRMITLCLVATTGDEVVGTMSLIFDHARKMVEWGRVATVPHSQRMGVLQSFIEPTIKILSPFSDYCLVTDTTTLNVAAQKFALDLKAIPVAFNPSSFIVQPDGLERWKNNLGDKHGRSFADAILCKSSRTGLGRFGTFYHMYRPDLRVGSNYGDYYNAQTRVRVLEGWNGTDQKDAVELIKGSEAMGCETVQVRVSRGGEQTILEQIGFFRTGCYKDGTDEISVWQYLLGREHFEQVLQGLILLSQDNFSAIAMPEGRELVSRVLGSMKLSRPKRVL